MLFYMYAYEKSLYLFNKELVSIFQSSLDSLSGNILTQSYPFI